MDRFVIFAYTYVSGAKRSCAYCGVVCERTLVTVTRTEGVGDWTKVAMCEPCLRKAVARISGANGAPAPAGQFAQ